MTNRHACSCTACRARDEREFWRIVAGVDLPPLILSGHPVALDGTVVERVQAYSMRTANLERDGWVYDLDLDEWIREARRTL